MKNRKHTFWSLLQRGRIVIPQIQRDYAYGRDTEKAINVRDELLTGMLESLRDDEFDPNKIMILDFVYGSIMKDKSMTPIDGQQRLTTLFLLHLYAAVKEARVEKSEFLKFSYETRHSANEFCKSLINNFKYDLDSKESLIDQIKEQAQYLNSYDDDPTILSMLVVLNDIHKKFYNVNKLWEKLTLQDRIVFYYLDLEKFGLTDDLYIKMNSRGKSLARYEIFKSSLERYLEEMYPTFKEEISNKLDVEWTNMLWEEGCEIDSGFLNLFLNVFIIDYYLKKSTPQKFDDADKCFKEMLSSDEDLKFFINFLDAYQKLFKKGSKGIEDYYNSFFYCSDDTLGKIDLIRVYWQSKDNIFRRATSSTLTWAELIMFYALTISLQNDINRKSLFFRFRQLRNLLANSEFLLRPENIHKMLLYTKELILNGALPTDTFNNNQIIEENSSCKISDIGNALLVYENHDILRGSLGLFINNKKDGYINTLNKFISIFDNNHRANTSLIRKALLSIGDYSQQDTDQKRFLLHKSDAWRSFFTINQRRKDQDKIVDIIDNISISGELRTLLEKIIDDYLRSDKKDWKYYFLKYDDQLHYQDTQGYYYWRDRVSKPLEVIMLNSSIESSINLEWNIYNWIIFDNNREITTLDDHGAAEVILYKSGISLNGVQNGIEVKATNENNTIYNKLIEGKIISTDGLFVVLDNEDIIEKGQELIIRITNLDQLLNKVLNEVN